MEFFTNTEKILNIFKNFSKNSEKYPNLFEIFPKIQKNFQTYSEFLLNSFKNCTYSLETFGNYLGTKCLEKLPHILVCISYLMNIFGNFSEFVLTVQFTRYSTFEVYSTTYGLHDTVYRLHNTVYSFHYTVHHSHHTV